MSVWKSLSKPVGSLVYSRLGGSPTQLFIVAEARVHNDGSIIHYCVGHPRYGTGGRELLWHTAPLLVMYDTPKANRGRLILEAQRILNAQRE